MNTVSNYQELLAAVMRGDNEIVISRNIRVSGSIMLAPDMVLRGKAQENGELPTVTFPNRDGIAITKNNRIADLSIQTDVKNRAAYNIL